MKYFYFYDCPRTGGTSFKRWALNAPNVKRVHFGDGRGWHHVPFRPRSELYELAPENQRIFTFTLLRDPVEHTASLYAKIRVHKHSYRNVLANLSFEKWIKDVFEEDRKSSPAPWGFSMVRFFDPKEGKLENAIANVESIDFVGFTERLNDDLNLMFKKANIKANFDGRRLNPGSRRFKLTAADRLAIKRIRYDDYQLVNYFREQRGLQPYG